MLLAAALAGYGSKSLSAVLAPAIGFARDGWTCTPGVAEHVAATAPTLAKTPAAAALLLSGAYTTGETVTNPELAALLREQTDFLRSGKQASASVTRAAGAPPSAKPVAPSQLPPQGGCWGEGAAGGSRVAQKETREPLNASPPHPHRRAARAGETQLLRQR